MKFLKGNMSVCSVTCIIFHILLFLKIQFCLTLPISQEKVERNQNSPGAATLIPFLKRFGYLENNGSSSTSNNGSEWDHEMLYTEDSIEDAIKEMQKFGALEQTGRLDNETLALLTRPRCGIPDVIHKKSSSTRSKRYVIGANGWNKRRITYRVENWTPQLSESIVLTEMRKAFEIWADYARLRFINSPRESQDDADISISFGRGYHGDTYPFDGSGGVLAHAYFPYGHGSLGGDIHFDLDENWSSNLKTEQHETTQDDYAYTHNVSFLLVAAHEIGHSLGLSHSPSTDSVMFPYYQGFEEGNMENVRLGYDDIMAMYKLYIQREIEDFGDNDDDMHVSTTTEHFTRRPHIPTSTDAHVPDYPAATTTAYDVTTRGKETFTSTTHPTTEDEAIPNICQDGFDTITFMRNELFVFKGKYMWRFKERGQTEPYYPVTTTRLFPMLANAAKIDAAFENEEGELIFFSGKYYWKYDGTKHLSALPLTSFGLPASLDKVDAAFIWEKNGKLYLFSDNLFWRYDTSEKRMDDGYPKGIERWGGLPTTGVDSALKWSDGITYFFKNDEFWRFDDTKVHTDDGFPMKTSSYWFGC